ncbi:hypothetical protein [Pandoravirus japonicus]|uniref:Uncharacterized protein n=1 Tax=Pandoravirus japonicus TaxID=2823154 RepID=A0A811BS80_9VIRU|nr:hypothetical protein [Pandoravirus japonicus]
MAEHTRATPRMPAHGRAALSSLASALGSLTSPAPRQSIDPHAPPAALPTHLSAPIPQQQQQQQQQQPQSNPQQQHPPYPQQQQQHPLVAVRVEIAALAASVNAAIVGMQAAVDGLTARLARLEKRVSDEARRTLDSQRVVADHVESLWRAIDGSREATNWCWARIAPAAEGVARMRVRLVGHQHHQPRHARDTPSEADAASEPALAVRLGEGAWLCVRYPMVHAPDDAGAQCVWMRTTLVDEADATMRPYWIKAYDLDAQVAFLADFTNVPPCFDAEPFGDDDDDSDESSDDVDTDVDDKNDVRADGPLHGEAADRDDRSASGAGGGNCHRADRRHAHGATVPAPIMRDGPQPNAVARVNSDDGSASTDTDSP